MGNPLGGSMPTLSHARRCASGACAFERRTAPNKSVARAIKARCAGVVQCSAFSIRCIRAPVIVAVVQFSACSTRRIRRPVLPAVVPLSVVPPNAVGCMWAGSVGHAAAQPFPGMPAQPAHAVDAAARPRDRGFCETENRPEVGTELSVAAQLMGNPLGRCSSAHLSFSTPDVLYFAYGNIFRQPQPNG